MEFFLFLLEITGTVSFAVSGAIVALKRNMDVFGVCALGTVTACGGGVLRDLFLGQLPPVMFREPVFPLTAVCVSAILFLGAVRRALSRRERAYERIQLVADAAGLGVFTAAGVAATFDAGYGDGFFFAVFLGTITGVGGGVLRDVLAGLRPYIFIKHIYALASIAGAVLCVSLWRPLGERPAMAVCVAAVVTIRLLAARFRWSLPRAASAGSGSDAA